MTKSGGLLFVAYFYPV